MPIRCPWVLMLLVWAAGACSTGPAHDATLPDADAARDASEETRPGPPGLSFALHPEGRIDLGVEGVPLDGLEFVVRLADGTERTLSSMLRTAVDAGVGGRDPSGLEVALRLVPIPGEARGGVAIEWSVGGGPARVQGVEIRSPALRLPAGAHPVVEGTQSWSYAGPLALNAGSLLPRDGNGRVRYPEVVGNPLLDVANLSWLRGDLAWNGTGLSICDGGAMDRWLVVSFERPGDGWMLRITAGLLADEVRVVQPGDPPLTGRVLLTPARPDEPFACSRWMSIERTRGTRPFPRGWWSWNSFFENVTSARIDAQLPPLAAIDATARHITVDDGWERAWGDWRVRPELGTTLEDLARSLAARGFTLGLWLAPFAVAPDAPIARDHPGWLLHDDAGAVLLEELVPGRRYAILDATHPEARGHLVSLFRGLREAGVRLFKIDFLYAGARVGRRHDPAATGLVAYRLGLAAIAAGAGDAHVNGCGAFVLPAVPYVDSLRVGADDTFANVPPFWAAVAAAARNLAARSGLWALGVAPDPDQPVVHGMSPDEGRAFLAVGALSGGAFGYGDDLSALTPAERALYGEAWFTALRDGLREPARPLGLADAVGTRYLQSPLIDRALSPRNGTQARPPALFAADLADGRRLVVAFNWTAAAQDVAVSDDAFAAGATPDELVAGATCRRVDGRFTVTVPAHAIRVLAGRPPF